MDLVTHMDEYCDQALYVNAQQAVKRTRMNWINLEMHVFAG